MLLVRTEAAAGDAELGFPPPGTNGEVAPNGVLYNSIALRGSAYAEHAAALLQNSDSLGVSTGARARLYTGVELDRAADSGRSSGRHLAEIERVTAQEAAERIPLSVEDDETSKWREQVLRDTVKNFEPIPEEDRVFREGPRLGRSAGTRVAGLANAVTSRDAGIDGIYGRGRLGISSAASRPPRSAPGGTTSRRSRGGSSAPRLGRAIKIGGPISGAPTKKTGAGAPVPTNYSALIGGNESAPPEAMVHVIGPPNTRSFYEELMILGDLLCGVLNRGQHGGMELVDRGVEVSGEGDQTTTSGTTTCEDVM